MRLFRFKRSWLQLCALTGVLTVSAPVTLLAFLQPVKSAKGSGDVNFSPNEIIVRMKDGASSGLPQGIQAASLHTLAPVPASLLNLHQQFGLKQMKTFLTAGTS